MSICTLDEIKRHLVGVTTDSYNTVLTEIRDGVEKLIKEYLNKEIEQTEYTQLYSGSGEPELILDNFPIVSISFISNDLDYENKSYGDVLESTDYIPDLESGILEYINASWTKGRNNYLIKYTAGYSTSTMPKDIKLVVYEIVAAKFYNYKEKREGINNKTVQGETVSYQFEDFKKAHKQILDKYKKHYGNAGITVTGWGEES